MNIKKIIKYGFLLISSLISLDSVCIDNFSNFADLIQCNNGNNLMDNNPITNFLPCYTMDSNGPLLSLNHPLILENNKNITINMNYVFDAFFLFEIVFFSVLNLYVSISIICFIYDFFNGIINNINFN